MRNGIKVCGRCGGTGLIEEAQSGFDGQGVIIDLVECPQCNGGWSEPQSTRVEDESEWVRRQGRCA